MKNARLFGARVLGLAAVLTLLSSLPASAAGALEASTFDADTWSDDAVGDVNPKVFALALKAAGTAVQRGEASRAETLTVIDYSRPSTMRRMWVYDLRSRSLLFEELVSHGRG